MNLPHDRLIFALSVLDGEEGAHRILGDMLEEEGDRGLAQWARARKGKRHKRIDFVLGLLPHQVSLGLACDFLAHSLDLMDKHEWRNPRMGARVSGQRLLRSRIGALSVISDWSRGLATSEQMAAQRSKIHSVGPWAHGIQDLNLATQALLVAVDYSIAASHSEDASTARHQASESRNSSRKVAKLSRQFVRPVVDDLRYHGSQAEREALTAEYDPVAWQFQHIRDVIHELLEE